MTLKTGLLTWGDTFSDAYALAVEDPYLPAPTAIGITLCAFQMGLRMVMPRSSTEEGVGSK